MEMKNVGIVTVAQPAAATDFTVTVPAGQIWLVHGIDFPFTTGVGATNRTIRVQGKNGADTFCTSIAPVSQAASITGTIHCIHGGANASVIVGTTQQQQISLSDDFILNGGETLNSAIIGITGTDQVGAVKIRRERLD